MAKSSRRGRRRILADHFIVTLVTGIVGRVIDSLDSLESVGASC